jgi:segregation and condensation protein A
VARFLALLDLYRQGNLRFDQVIALGELQISWTGADEGEIEFTDEFDTPAVPDALQDALQDGSQEELNGEDHG